MSTGWPAAKQVLGLHWANGNIYELLEPHRKAQTSLWNITQLLVLRPRNGTRSERSWKIVSCPSPINKAKPVTWLFTAVSSWHYCQSAADLIPASETKTSCSRSALTDVYFTIPTDVKILRWCFRYRYSVLVIWLRKWKLDCVAVWTSYIVCLCWWLGG